jgi:phosphate transport system permease protein
MTVGTIDYRTPTQRQTVPVVGIALLVLSTLLVTVQTSISSWIIFQNLSSSGIGFWPGLGLLLIHVAVIATLLVSTVAVIRAPSLPGSDPAIWLTRVARLGLYAAIVTTFTTFQFGRHQSWTWYEDWLWTGRLVLVNLLPIALFIYFSRSASVGNALGDELGSRMGEVGMKMLSRDAGIFVLGMLAALLIVLTVAAMPSIRTFGFSFIVTRDWRPNELEVPKKGPDGKVIIEDGEVVTETIPPSFGALPVIWGTTASSIIALVVAIPLSLGTAIFLVRIAARWLVEPVSFLVEFLAAIPSIAYGLWGLFVLCPLLAGNFVVPHWASGVIDTPVARHFFHRFTREQLWNIPDNTAGAFFYDGTQRREPFVYIGSIEAWANRVCSATPGLRWLSTTTGVSGRDMLAGGLILAIMILPIITAISRDVLRNVPRAQVEGTVALGATWWQSSKEMLKYSRSGLFGAIMLGLARAAGETMAITMVIGNNSQIKLSPFAPAQTMSSLLANEFAEANTDLHRAALTEVALILLVMSLLFNVIARYLVVGKQSRTAAAA